MYEVTRLTKEYEYSPSLSPQITEAASANLEGIVLLRDCLLTNLLGSDTAALLYWAGKELARQHPLNDLEETSAFFSEYSFGTLSLVSETKRKIRFTLTGDIVALRLQKKDVSFSLEAGFLSQQCQFQKLVYCEAEYSIHHANKSVEILLTMDPKQKITEVFL